MSLGVIYETTASNVLQEAYPGMSSRERSGIFERGEVSEIEQYIEVAEPLRIGTEALRTELEPYGIQLPKQTFAIAMGSQCPAYALSDVHSVIPFANISGCEAGKIIVNVLRAIHDYTVEQAVETFFDTDCSRGQYIATVDRIVNQILGRSELFW